MLNTNKKNCRKTKITERRGDGLGGSLAAGLVAGLVAALMASMVMICEGYTICVEYVVVGWMAGVVG